MRLKSVAQLTISAAFASLGGLWLLQGLRIVSLQPVLCVADCEAVAGASLRWALVGGATVAASIAVCVAAVRAAGRSS